jgi:cytochrome c oxidase cbb3-type subunit 3
MGEEHKPDTLKDEGYAFDGIQEYDNNLPRWWLWLFFLTIVWAIWYIPFYHGGPGKVGPESLREDLAALAAERGKLNAGSALDEAGLRALAGDPARLAAGKQLYAQNCVACHGPEGLGGVGPNLRDRHWIIEPTMTGLTGVLEKGGRTGKGMQSFAHLGTDGVRNLAVFVVSLNRAGLKPNPAKPPASDEQEKPLDW